MVILQITSLLSYLCFLPCLITPIQAGDPSQQHPITALDPPKCASVPHSRDNCNMTSDTISQCTYRHCHVQFPTGCTDWWQVLDLNCVCGALSTLSCSLVCLHDIAWTSYLVWLQKTCTVIPGWAGIPSGTYIPIPSTAKLLATDLHIQPPQCISSHDTQFFDQCKMKTLDVYNLPMAPTLRIDGSKPWQLDQNCFCGQDSFSNIINGSTCADNALDHSKAFLWINNYCGTYASYSRDLVDWRNALFATTLTVQPPSCISPQHTQALSSCTMNTSDVSGLSSSSLGPYRLDRDCFCGQYSFSDITTRSTCGDDAAEYSKALLWLNAYCGTYAGYSQTLTYWRNALFATPLNIKPPSCVSSQDAQALDSCTVKASDVFGLTTSSSEPYRLDRDCFCGRNSLPDIISRSTCGSNTVGYSKTLLWINAYCGTYANYSQELLNDWRNALFATDLSARPPSCISSQDVQAFNDCAISTTNVSGLSQGQSKPYQLDRNCFCGHSSFSDTMNRSTCMEDTLGYYKALLWINAYCETYQNFSKEMPFDWQNAVLLPWKEQTHRPNTILADVVISPTSHEKVCPTANEKLTSFAIVNIFMAVLVPILGRRTVVNKLSFGYLGHTNSKFWLVTGLIGVALHLSSNAVNAVIIRKVPGYENISVTHLVFLWCTRPRLAWLIVACVPFQAKKAMYFSVTASTLITEFVLQIFAAAYMGRATNYGRLMSFYKTSFIQGLDNPRGPEARIMYAGCLLWLIVFPFALMVCAWSVLGIGSHLRSLSTYLVGMESSVRKQSKIASRENAKLVALMNDGPLGQDGIQVESIRQHYQYLFTQSSTLAQEWTALQTSIIPIPQKMRKDRRERNQAAEARGADQGWNYELERRIAPWFLDPPQRAKENNANATRISANIVSVQRQRYTLQQQARQKEQYLATVEGGSKILRKKIDELYATANLVHARLQGNNTRRPDWSAVSQLSPDDQQRLQNLEQRHSSAKLQIRELKDLTQLQVKAVAIYEQIEQSLGHLALAYGDISDCWKKVEKDRLAEAEAERRRNSFVAIPMVVLTGMLITWIAQWLWWGGYVHVAQDAYCPPKLVTLTAVWTVFSASSAAVGAST